MIFYDQIILHIQYQQITYQTIQRNIPFSFSIYLFNQSISTGYFPKMLKTARVVPIYKSGVDTNVTNYHLFFSDI